MYPRQTLSQPVLYLVGVVETHQLRKMARLKRNDLSCFPGGAGGIPLHSRL